MPEILIDPQLQVDGLHDRLFNILTDSPGERLPDLTILSVDAEVLANSATVEEISIQYWGIYAHCLRAIRTYNPESFQHGAKELILRELSAVKKIQEYDKRNRTQ